MSPLDRLFLLALTASSIFTTMIDNMTESKQISEGITQELLTTVKSLQADMAELKSGATGGGNTPTDKSGHATLLDGSDARGNPRKRQLPGKEADSSDDKNPITNEEEGGTTFSLSEEGNAFIEAAFKSRLDNDSRSKKKAKLWLPDSKWLKSPEQDSFIASTRHPQRCYQSRFDL